MFVLWWFYKDVCVVQVLHSHLVCGLDVYPLSEPVCGDYDDWLKKLFNVWLLPL